MDHPRNILLGSQAGTVSIPVCDHYCGVEARISKSLQLQTELMEEFGTCVLDVTLDCEDGAPIGGEVDHANMVAAGVISACIAPKVVAILDDKKPKRRVATRVHAVDHASFESDIDIVIGKAGVYLSHVMIPKVDTLADVERAVALIDAANQSGSAAGLQLPLHVLLESPKAIHNAFEIAAHPRVQSLSFGLMDFVSSHSGAIPASAMGLAGQFTHPLVVRAKLAIASTCHAHGKVPSHCVVTEFADANAIKNAASQAANTMGYTRMWSIHPSQIRPILTAFAPDEQEVETATYIIGTGLKADWAPINYKGALHDRASYRYYWQVLERAHQTGRAMDTSVAHFF